MRHRLAELLVVIAANAGIVVALFAVNLALAQPSYQAASRPSSAGAGCVDAPAAALSASNVSGGGGVCLDDGGVHPALRVSGLSPGEVYTAWLGYFDRPSACAQSPCGVVDLRGDAPPGVLVRIGGGVAREDGELELRSDLADLRLAAGAQVTLLLLNHGPAIDADHRARARQLLTPQRPDLGAPMGGAAADGARGWPHAQVILIFH